MNDTEKSDNDAELHARLARLQEALRERDEQIAAQDAAAPVKRSPFVRAMSVGLNAFSEFVGAIVVSGVIGWQADAWLGTKPWLLLLMLALGTAAGFWSLYRVAAPKGPPGGEIADEAAATPAPSDTRAGRTPPGKGNDS